MARDISKLILRIDDESGWVSIMESSDSKLVIIDIHQEWCGYCEAIHPTFARVYNDFDSPEERLVFAAASIQKVGTLIQPSLPHDSHINLDKNGCSPLFALFRNRTCVSVVSGVDAPTLVQQIGLNIPDKPSKETQE